jgi:hypothetical protein
MTARDCEAERLCAVIDRAYRGIPRYKLLLEILKKLLAELRKNEISQVFNSHFSSG